MGTFKPDMGRECPYCGATMTWIPMRWFGRGTFACERCGEFPDLRPRAVVAADALSHPAPPPPLAATGDTRPRVLMIDDSTAERDLYALMLERDVQVLTASRGSEGLALAQTERPDAIVLDVMMPEMNGWEVCKRLKSNPATASIPVVMLTAQDGPDLITEAARHGAATLLTKPCPVDKLTSVLASAISGAGRD
jgi:two-component system, sensor histidine kinase and response regulator